MLQFLPGPILGVLMVLLLLINTVFWVIPVYTLILIKLITPKGRPRDAISRLTAYLAQLWAAVNVRVVDTLLDIRWDIRIDASIDPRGQYLVCSNHQTWNDIFVLFKVFGRKAPFFKFFLKQELIWVPLLGLAWWGLDYPFMKRYGKAQLKKHPELRGKDLQTTRKACEAFRNQPAMILNFLEGTRFTAAKHARQNSPYRHLLKPKSGGFAFTLSALGAQLNSLLDVTIVYPEGANGFWDFMCGKMRHVVIEVRQLTLPDDFFAGDYESDTVFRARFQKWVAQLWKEKDQQIDDMLARSRR